MSKKSLTALTRVILISMAFPAGVALAAPQQAEEQTSQAGAAERPMLKQPAMPMRRTTQKQREDAAKQLKAQRDDDARKHGRAPEKTRQLPTPQPLPTSRSDK
jgi:hypothetical protein